MIIIGEEMKPCPFCDGAVAPQHLEWGVWMAGCANDDCPVCPEARASSKAKAIRLWNTRSPEAVTDDLAGKLALAIQKARDEIGATEQQRMAFAYAEAAVRAALSKVTVV